MAFDWDYVDPKRGLLRTRISANWRITRPAIHSDFYTRDQQRMIREIFEGITCPDWHKRFDKQIQDDDAGFGTHQTIALFGTPGSGKLQFVLTGRHMTVRCDGHAAAEYAFGGPIFYGHAASGFHEKPGTRAISSGHRPRPPTRCTTCSIASSRKRPCLPRPRRKSPWASTVHRANARAFR